MGREHQGVSLRVSQSPAIGRLGATLPGESWNASGRGDGVHTWAASVVLEILSSGHH